MNRQKILTTIGVFLAVFLVASGAKLFTLFFPEFERQGISMSTISFISIFSTAAIFVSGLYVGKLIEKYGVRKVMLTGCCLMAAAYFLFGTGKIGLIFVGFVFLGTATTLCGYTPASLAISGWYREKRGLAISAVFTGMTLGASLYSGLCGILFTKFGMSFAGSAIAGFMMLVAFPAILLLVREAPYTPDASENQKTDNHAKKSRKQMTLIEADPAEARKTLIFVQIIAVTMMAGGFVSVVQSYLPAHLQAEGLSVLLSSEIFSVMMLMGTAGTILGGIISDRFGTRAFLLSTSASFWLATWIVIFCTENQGLLYLAAVLMGFASPLCSVTSSLLMSSTFGPKAYAGLLGIVQASASLSIGILFPIAGMMYRMQGTYRWMFILINVLMIVMVIVAFAATSEKAKQKTRL